MRKTIWVLFLVLTGCATAIPLSYEEYCATQQMKLVDVSTGSTTTNSYATVYSGGNSASGIATGVSNSEYVRCRALASDDEKQEMMKLKAIAAPKVDYNDGISGKRFLTGAGYFLYILPGIGLKLMYDGQKNDALEKSRMIEADVMDPKREVSNVKAHP